MKTTRLTVKELLAWGYGHANSDIRFITNVIQCQCGRKHKKLLGLLQLVNDRCQVQTAQFDLFKVSIDGRIYGIEVLESPALVERWKHSAPVA